MGTHVIAYQLQRTIVPSSVVVSISTLIQIHTSSISSESSKMIIKGGMIIAPPLMIKTLDSSIFGRLSSTVFPPLPLHVHLHISQHPPYEREGVFMVAPIPSTADLPGLVIFTATPPPHGRLAADLPPTPTHTPLTPPPPALKWTTSWPGISACNPGK